MMNEQTEGELIYNILDREYLIIHREAVSVDELIEIGQVLGVIE